MQIQSITTKILQDIGVDDQGKVTLYKYIDTEGAISILKNKTFKFSRVKDFNDPFDLYDSMLDFSKFEPISVQYKSRKERRNIEKVSLKRRVSILNKLWKENKSNFGITCLSKTFDNILMWSHYAEKHQGVCLGFELDVIKLINDNFITYAVKYIDDFEREAYFDKDEIKRLKVISKYLSTKAKFWEYEKEVRIVNLEFFKKYNSQFLGFEKYATIKEVLLGFKMEESNRKLIRQITQKTRTRTTDMVNCKDKFAINKKQ